MATFLKEIPATRGDWKIQYFPEAASQSFVVGDILTIDASGQISIGSAADSDLTSAGDDIVGIAGEAASGTTNNYVKVLVPVDFGSQVLLPVEHATAASAVTAEAQVGDTLVLSHEGGVWAAAIDTTSNPVIKVMDIASDYAVGTQYGRVWVSFIASVRFAI